MTKNQRTAVFLIVAALVSAQTAHADDWPQWLGPQRDGVWRETGIVSKFPAGGPPVKWRTPIGAGYSGPAVAQGKVFITDRMLAKGVSNPANPFEKDARVDGVERILCLDEATGKILWKFEYDCLYQLSYASGPRTTPAVAGDKVYAVGAMGHLYCLNIKDGSVVWSHDLPKKYSFHVPVWGFAGHPLVDGNRLICLVGGKGSVAVAFDKDTGKEIWKALSAKDPGYAPPMIYEIGGKRQLIVWHPESINSLNPETGEVYWSQSYFAADSKKRALKANLSIPTPRADKDRLFFTAFYDGPLMLDVKSDIAVAWRGNGRGEKPDETDGLHCIMSTPFFKGDYIYGVGSYGELRCLDAKTGKRLWSTHQVTGGKSLRWANAFLVSQGDRFVLFNELGDLIIARLTPEGYQEISRANILVPTNTMAGPAGRRVIWSHPAFAERCVFARNDREIVCVSMEER